MELTWSDVWQAYASYSSYSPSSHSCRGYTNTWQPAIRQFMIRLKKWFGTVCPNSLFHFYKENTMKTGQNFLYKMYQSICKKCSETFTFCSSRTPLSNPNWSNPKFENYSHYDPCWYAPWTLRMSFSCPSRCRGCCTGGSNTPLKFKLFDR